MPVELDKAVADFQAEATSGQQVKLSDLKGQQVVLYFYPKDATPGCTSEGRTAGAVTTTPRTGGGSSSRRAATTSPRATSCARPWMRTLNWSSRR